MHVRPAALLCLLLTPLLSAQDPKPKSKPVDFAKQVWPILQQRCVSCHETEHTGADGKVKKPKGRVVLDTKDGIETSKRGKLVVAGKSTSSLLLETVSLPADDEDRMPPPKEGDPLTKEQIDLIRRWIDDGADFGTWTGTPKGKGEGDGKEKEKDGGKGKGEERPGKGDAEPPKGGTKQSRADVLRRLEQGLAPLPAATLAAFDGGPFTVRRLGDDSALVGVGCAGHTDAVDDDALRALAPIAAHVAELDLGRTRVGDAGCAVIATMPRLVALDLRQTAVGNHGAKALTACKELRSLNLFGTKVGDYGAAALAELKALEDLYVWQTEVSAGAVVRLRESLPGLRVVLAAELPEPMSDAPATGPRRR